MNFLHLVDQRTRLGACDDTYPTLDLRQSLPGVCSSWSFDINLTYNSKTNIRPGSVPGCISSLPIDDSDMGTNPCLIIPVIIDYQLADN